MNAALKACALKPATASRRKFLEFEVIIPRSARCACAILVIEVNVTLHTRHDASYALHNCVATRNALQNAWRKSVFAFRAAAVVLATTSTLIATSAKRTAQSEPVHACSLASVEFKFATQRKRSACAVLTDAADDVEVLVDVEVFIVFGVLVRSLRRAHIASLSRTVLAGQPQLFEASVH